MYMTFCRLEKCRYYAQEPNTFTGRKCYYEAGCILGYLDVLVTMVKIRLKGGDVHEAP